MSPVRPFTEPLNRPVRLGVLISGGGTTMDNFIARIAAGRMAAEIACVVSSRADCAGVEKARAAGLPVCVVSREQFADVETFSEAVFAPLREAGVDLVTLAGFLSLIHVPEDFRHRVLNIHPALIPAFCGRGFFGHRVHEAALDRGVKFSGCTVHFVDDHYDHGPIVVQKSVPVYDGDTPDVLAARVFEAECEAYPEAVDLYAQARLEIVGRCVRVLPQTDLNDRA